VCFHSPLTPDPSDDTIWALKDVSFTVKRGEVVGTLAPHCVRCSAAVGRRGVHCWKAGSRLTRDLVAVILLTVI